MESILINLSSLIYINDNNSWLKQKNKYIYVIQELNKVTNLKEKNKEISFKFNCGLQIYFKFKF